MSGPALRLQPPGTDAPDRSGQHLTLFRQQVIDEQRNQWLGPVLLMPRSSFPVIVVASCVAAIAVLALIAFGSFTRKAALSGWLVPQQGTARVFAPQAGVVSKIHVVEGSKVQKGMPLLTVSSDMRTEIGEAKKEVVSRIIQRRNNLASAIEMKRRLLNQEGIVLTQRLEALNRQRLSLTDENDVLREQAQLSSSILVQERMSGVDAHAPSTTRQAYAQVETKLHALDRERASMDREIAELHGKLRTFPLYRQSQLADMERELAAVQQELAEAEARRQVVITAPQDGTVSGLQTEVGGNVTSASPLMTILPNNSLLHAQLFGTSRAVGFLRPGQRVLLRYQAFPYQKFGLYEGVISHVSSTAVSPSELTQQLSGLQTLYRAGEPIYRVNVDLAQQTARAYGEEKPLQAGMQVDADVMLESRKLIEWILDPLYSITGRVN